MEILNQTLRGGQLKDFQIGQKLGEGSFAQVYKVTRISDGEEYAMKKVKIQLLKTKEKENALNEVRILASLSDEYIVGYKEAFIDNNELYVIMEYCPQGDIQKKITELQKKNNFYSEQEIWKAFIHMLKGVKCLHEMKIVHRDLKCANIFINKEGVYKLGDLNVSKIAKKGFVYTQMGTPYYAAPEVWKDEPYDFKCDIWSIGCVVYEMASKNPPFKAIDMDALYKRIQKGQYERIPSRFSNDLQNMISQCLKVNPRERPSATQLLQNQIMQKYIPNDIIVIENNNNSLLNTIKCPQNLLQLKGKLPKSNYEKKTKEIKQNKSCIGNNNNNKLEKIEEQPSQIRKNRIVSAGQVRSPLNPQQKKQENKNINDLPEQYYSRNRPQSQYNSNKQNINLIEQQKLPQIINKKAKYDKYYQQENKYEYLYQKNEMKQIIQKPLYHNQMEDLYKKYKNPQYRNRAYSRPYSAKESPSKMLLIQQQIQRNQELQERINNKQKILFENKNEYHNGRIVKNYISNNSKNYNYPEVNNYKNENNNNIYEQKNRQRLVRNYSDHQKRQYYYNKYKYKENYNYDPSRYIYNAPRYDSNQPNQHQRIY